MTKFRKLLLAGVLVVALAASVFLPARAALAQSQAGSNVAKSGLGWMLETAVGLVAGDTVASGARALYDWGTGAQQASLKDAAINYGLARFGGLLTWAAEINPFDNVYTQCDTTSTVGSPGCGIRAGHSFLLSLVNILYIFILLAVAIGTILGAESYSMQRLLPRLVIAILLSNFGLFAVAAIANFAQLLTQGLLGPPGTIGSNVMGAVLDPTDTAVLSIAEQIAGELPGVGFLIEMIKFLLDPRIWVLIGLVLVTTVLILRIAGLWVLAIAAPFGVAAGVLPATQAFGKLFWRKVISYAMVGPVMIFFLRLGIIFAGAIKPNGSAVTQLLLLNIWGQDSFLARSAVPMFRYMVFAAILYMGLMVSRKMGVEVADFTISAFEKAFKGAWGFVGGYAKFLSAAYKTVGQAGLAIGAGPAGLGGATAARLGLSATQAKNVSTAAGIFSSNLRDQGILAPVSKFFGKRSEELGKWSKEKAEKEKNAIPVVAPEPPHVNPEAQVAGNAGIVAGANEMEKTQPVLVEQILTDILGTLQDMRTRGASAEELQQAVYEGARKGVVNEDNITDVLRSGGITEGTDAARLVRAEAGQYDMRTMAANATGRRWGDLNDSEQVDFVNNWLANNSISKQGEGALREQTVAQAINGRTDFDQLIARLSRAQQRSLGAGMATFGLTRLSTGDNDANVQRAVLRTAQLGNDVLDPKTGILANNAAWAGRTTLQQNIQNRVLNDVNYVVNQTPGAVRRWAANPNMSAETAVSIANDTRVSEAARGALVGAAKQPGALPDDTRFALLGNSKLALSRLSDDLRKFSGRLESIEKKTDEAVEAAGKAAKAAKD